MIRNDVLAVAVSEVAIAGTLKDTFLEINAAIDLLFRLGTDVPTLRMEGATSPEPDEARFVRTICARPC